MKKLMNNDYIFSVLAKGFGVLLGIVMSVILARYLGDELKGVHAVIENNVQLYSVFLGLGIYQAYPFFRKKEDNLYPHFINHITTQFLLYLVIGSLVAIYVGRYTSNLYLAISIAFMPLAVYIKQLNYIVLIECPRRRNVGSIIISCSEIIILAIMWLVYKASFASIIIYYGSAQIFNLIISFANLKINPFSIRIEFKRFFEFAKFGFVPMLVLLCMTINYKIDIAMLKAFDNVELASIGVYSIGVGLADKIWLIPDAMKDILLSKLVKGKKEEEVARVLRLNLAICIFSILGLLILGKPAIKILYGLQYTDSYYVMLLMMIGVVGMIFYKMVYSYNISQGKRIINLIFLGIAAVVNVIGNYFAIPLYGIWGAAIVSIVSYNICGICFLVYFHKKSGIPYKQLIFMQKSDLVMLKRMMKK